jgi:hypothetical protein
MSNPFFYGAPVPADLFLDRRRELRRISGRIANRGQSTAVVGEPRSGKTSLLLYLESSEARARFYGTGGDRLVFSYLDAQTLGGQFTQAQFWEYALRPLHERAVGPNPGSPLAQAYQTCRENHFGTFVLERFFVQMGQTDWRLVLMLDEFDVLLYHPVLNSAEFFGGLRGLTSCSQGVLALVIANRCSLASLHKDTQQLSRAGSPYFNFLDEITLGPWPNKAVNELLDWGADRFTPDDRRFITQIAGGHPYLLQVAAFELWEAYEEGEEDPDRRRREAGHRLYDKVALTLDDTWRLWSPETRQVFATIALAHINSLAQRGLCREVSTWLEGYSSRGKVFERRHLRRLLIEHFDVEDLRTLCFDLGEDYDSLRGEGKAGRARELVAHLERCGRISELVALGSAMRPNASWDAASSPATEAPFAFQTVPPERLSRDSRSELNSLFKQGFVKEAASIAGGWRVRPGAFLWWLAGEATALIEAAARGAGDAVAREGGGG